jgi:hypothetical protein
MVGNKAAYRGLSARLILVSTILIVLGIVSSSIGAQSGSLSVTMTSEENIGFECPVTAAIDPAGTTLWVLMHNCWDGDYNLRTFSVGSGSPTNDDDHNFAAALAGLEGTFVDPFSTSIAFTPDGELSITYADENFIPANVSIAAGADGSDSTEGVTSGDIGSLLANYSEYPGTTVYNGDHTQAVAIGENSLHILDLQTGTQILEMEVPGDSYNSYPSFSADGQQLYITQLHNPDDMSATASTLYVYNLPDGALVTSYEVLSPFVWVSPNGQYAALLMSDEELAVVELAENNYSQPIQMWEEPRPLTACLNTGQDMTDVDFIVSGELYLMDLEWLPDSSGFITLNSYMGDGALGDGGNCLFNYSRLRRYSLSYE